MQNRQIKFKNLVRLQQIEKSNNMLIGHLHRIRNMPSSIDNSKPATWNLQFLNCQKKKEQIYTEHCSEIERENKILLNKLNRIQTDSNASNIRRSVSNLSTDREKYKIEFSKKFMRSQQLRKIDQENYTILRRILEKKSNYDLQKFLKERETKERILANISDFPLPSIGRQRSSPNKNLISLTQESELETSRNEQSMFGEVNKRLFKKSRVINKVPFICELWMHSGQLQIVLNNAQLPQKFILTFPLKQGLEFFSQEFHNKFNELVQSITKKFSNYIILGTQYKFQEVKAIDTNQQNKEQGKEGNQECEHIQTTTQEQE